jgi:hypothetical protein
LRIKQILDAVRVASKSRTEPIEAATARLIEKRKTATRWTSTANCLKKPLSIIGVKAEKDIDSLFTAGGTTALTGDIKGLDDFELIL